tara:strand:- start:5012 stop:5266 length:255 start_codon:yes stop_codon:yes gene_type:complete
LITRPFELILLLVEELELESEVQPMLEIIAVEKIKSISLLVENICAVLSEDLINVTILRRGILGGQSNFSFVIKSRSSWGGTLV